MKGKLLFIFTILLACIIAIPNVFAQDQIVECNGDLSSLVSSAEDGTIIKLNNECTVSATIDITKNITIDLNGHNIKTSDNVQYVFDVKADNVLITNSGSNASIEGKDRGIKVSKGTLTIENVTVKSQDRTIQINPEENQKAKVIINQNTTIESTSESKPRTIMLWGNNTADSAELIVNGGTIKAPYTSKNSAAINLGSDNAAGNKVTINGGIIQGYNGVRLYGNGTEGMTVLTMNDGTINAANAGVIQSTAAGTENTVISIYGGSITAQHEEGADFQGDSVAIYHGQKGKLTIGKEDGTGPTLTGQTGVSVKEGNVLIQGGNIVANGIGRTVVTERIDGTEDSGAAVSITTNSESDDSIELTITGGNLVSNNGYALYEGITVDSNGNPTADNTKVSSLNIAGGNFTGKTGSVEVTGYQEKGFITGGQFNGNLDSSYLHAGLVLSANGQVVSAESQNEANPDTSDTNIYLFSGLLLISGLAIAYTLKKRYN